MNATAVNVSFSQSSEQSHVVRVFPAGSTIFREGEPGDCAYVVEEGEVEVTAFVQGQPLVIGNLKAGELFGEMALLDGHVRSATAFVKTHARVIQVHRDHISETLRASDPMVRFFLKSILARYREMRDRLAVSADARRLRAIGDASTPAPSRGPDRDSLRASSILRQDVRLRTAFKANELEVFAQPIHDAASGKPVAAEMLVRWRNPRRGLLGADSVIPAAERSGLIVEIGYWILEQACGYIARLDAEYRERGRHNPMRYFSVNVSPRQFDDEHFVDKAEVIMHAHGVDPGRITFEITESMILQESKRTESQLPRLKALGCGIALDDFGTGYSSLTHMLKFPIDTLKIDRSFVSRMNNDAKAKNIVASLIALSQNLGIHVIAEGAEREADLLSLRAMGCGSVQGYLYSAPLKLEELSEYLGTF